MSAEATKRKRILFVDDEPAFLTLMRDLLASQEKGHWEVFTAENHAQALAELQRSHPDLVVLDIGMPVMDGIQFLRLLRRSHPDQQVVMLTGNVSEANRKTCLDEGAALFLQKPVSEAEFTTVLTALEVLAASRPTEGFRGVMKRVGLHEVLQFECLGKRSSILEIFTGKVRGRIYIADGAIVHAESGSLVGEVALYSLLALRGGEFNLLSFAEPRQRTIEGSWEMLLMEAARLSDEAAHSEGAVGEPAAAQPAAPAPSLPDGVASLPASELSPERAAPPRPTALAAARPGPGLLPPAPTQTLEVLLCSGAGEVLYDWQCPSIEQRLALMGAVEQIAARISSLASVGRFERLEVETGDGRTVCQLHPQRRLLVRSGRPPAG
jgi:CheY-like chemotaxis protein